MDNPSQKKAELDKDGILYDFDKAELDKDGMSLSDEPKYDNTAPSETQQQQQAPVEEAPKPTSTRRKIIYASAATGLILVLIIAGALTYHFTKKKPVEAAPVAIQKPTPPPGLDSPQGEITLDPFLVLYNSNNTKESGVLLAQLSLHVSPEIAYNIGSRMFDIRNIIYQRLSANAEVYSKYELAGIIRDDLKNLNVKDVAFIQFEKR